MAGLRGRQPGPGALPAEFRLDRAALAKHHLGFGRGAHRCLGTPLPLLEGRLAMGRLLELLDDLAPAEEATTRAPLPGVIFRLPTAVVLRFRAT